MRFLQAKRLSCIACASLACLVASLIVGRLGQNADRAASVSLITWAPPAQSPDFLRDVAPILGRSCMGCHSGAKPAGALSLESRLAILKGGSSGKPAIVVGDGAHSRMVQFVAGEVHGMQMPPKGAPLDSEKVEILRRWIDAGASWGPTDSDGQPIQHWHWAYRPPVHHDAPSISDPSWPRNYIDSFVLARLDANSLVPSPEAGRSALIRRLSLDLVGLPPTPEEVEAFVTDPASDAYEKVVDRLLESPHYGERWARLWLDLARYSDTNGYEKDASRSMWPWRDWVIDAINRDVPFTQFTIEQLAGDLLPNASVDQVVASGFNRNTQTNEEGGTDVEEFRVDAVFDRVDTVSTVWLGSTFGCARCHDHKFDPVSQLDYYRLFAFFNQDALDVEVFDRTEKRAAGAMVTQARLDQQAEFARLQDEISAVQAELGRDTPELASGQDRWESQLLRSQAAWTFIAPLSAHAEGSALLAIQPDHSVLATGPTSESDSYTLEFEVPADTTLAGLRIELLPDDSLPSRGPGRAENGNLVLSEVRLATSGVDIPFKTAVADFEQHNYGSSEHFLAVDVLDGASRTGWAIGPNVGRAHVLVLPLTSPLPTDTSPTRLTLRIEQRWGGRHTLGRFRISLTDDPALAATQPPAPELIDLLSKSAPDRTPDEIASLRQTYRAVAPETADIRTRLADLQARLTQLTVGSTLVMAANPEARTSHLLTKGNFLAPADPVHPAVPVVLPQVSADLPANRLGFAQWLVDPSNPLTARVLVNRWWEQFFGRGLVETSEDFGTQGDSPTHPELLDELALRFMENGWSMKQLCRDIVCSSAYRQSSHCTPELLERDPSNRLIARASRFRVEAEMIRDVALSASGLLSPSLGGPSVFPPQPPGIWTMIYNSDQWINSTGSDRYRRGLYTFWRRTAPYPTFTTFDAPSREITCTRRARTNTPLQALITLNDPQFTEAAGALALRVSKEAGSDPAQRIARAFRLCVARAPSEVESARILDLYTTELGHFAADPDSTTTYLQSIFTDSMLRPEVDRILADPAAAADLAAMSLTANVLLNLDETLTRQ